jgi:hypothetical protein
MPESFQPRPLDRFLRIGAIALGIGSCIPMLAMLPAGIVAAGSALGVHATSGPAPPVGSALAPLARPLLVLATLSLVIAALRCGIRPAALAATGGTLLYLSMYVLPSGGRAMRGMANMAAPHSTPTSAQRAGAAGLTNGPVFYAGLAAIVATYVWSGIRRRRHACRPAPRFAPAR